MRPQEYQQNVLSIVRKAVGQQAMVRYAYENVEAAGHCDTPTVLVELKEDGALFCNVCVIIYVPQSQGAQACQDLMDQIRTALYDSNTTDCKDMREEATIYLADERAYCAKGVIYFGETTALTFQGYQVLAFADQIKLMCKRQVKSFFSPFIGDVVQDLGQRANLLMVNLFVSQSTFQALHTIFEAGTPGDVTTYCGTFRGVISNMQANNILENRVNLQLTLIEVQQL